MQSPCNQPCKPIWFWNLSAIVVQNQQVVCIHVEMFTSTTHSHLIVILICFAFTSDKSFRPICIHNHWIIIHYDFSHWFASSRNLDPFRTQLHFRNHKPFRIHRPVCIQHPFWTSSIRYHDPDPAWNLEGYLLHSYHLVNPKKSGSPSKSESKSKVNVWKS